MKYIALILILIGFTVSAQSIDVQTYRLDIQVNDSNNIIRVKQNVQILFTESCNAFQLDLATLEEDGKGMKVKSVLENNLAVDFKHANDILEISTTKGVESNVIEYTIDFEGIPKDGLIISENKFGDRTFFGDNWPNRAHNWFACVDHPSDKASINYTISAPSHYQCVANGMKIKSYPLNKHITKHLFMSDISLPTKVMVFGLANFEQETVSVDSSLVVKSWVYKQDKENGFHDMAVALDPLSYFVEVIGPYPFEKLDNVQSTTRFGGMENAGCIFYDENAVKGVGSMENLIAHEIAHQWFGNSVTETGWEHLWLSEGFATYFTSLHLEQKYGRSKMNEQLIKERKRVISFNKSIELPVIDTISTNLMHLLNPNAYQKGAWVLHMLRNKVGDHAFWEGIRSYYSIYKYKNASSDDFKDEMQKTSGLNLEKFFYQWLTKTGHPLLQIVKTQKKSFIIEQSQSSHIFHFPLEVEVTFNDGGKEFQTIDFKSKQAKCKVKNKSGISEITLDPRTRLLFEEII